MTKKLANSNRRSNRYASKNRANRGNSRPVTQKRVNGVRLSWFVIGAIFGIGMSFLMNMFVTNIVVPEYDRLVKEQAQKRDIAGLEALPFDDAKLVISEIFESKPKIEKKESVVAEEAVNEEAPAELAAEPLMPEYPKTNILTVANGDTLLKMLVRESVDYDEAVDAIEALKKTYNPRNLRVGQKLALSLDPHPESSEKAVISELSIKLNKIDSVKLSRLASGTFSVEKNSLELSPELVFAGGMINNSLFETGYDAGIPSGVLAELVKAYSFDVDFQRQIQRGDQIEVLFEKMKTDAGEEVGYGKIIYAMLKTGSTPLHIYRFEDKDGIVRFYNEKGESVVKALLKTPINGARMSSGYGMRRHPILGYSKMHKGIDFAAPTGTPIYAAGDGVVNFRGRKGGYGNYLRIKHNGTYSTAYAHLSRFGKGIKNGTRVKQGQVVAYVGSTGRSTGPHLHYEILRHGKQVNPSKEKFKTGKTLKGKELASFQSEVNKIKNQIASMPKISTKVASSR